MLDTSQPEEVLLDENKEAEEHDFYMVRHCTRAVMTCLALPSAVLCRGLQVRPVAEPPAVPWA